jgi:hypothetical protein
MRLPLKNKVVSFNSGTKGNWAGIDDDSISVCSASTKQSGMILPNFSLRNLSRRVSLNSSANRSANSNLPSISHQSHQSGVTRRGSLNSSFSSLQERFSSVGREYGKLDNERENDSAKNHFDLTSMLMEHSHTDLTSCDEKESSFRTLSTAVDSSSDDEEASLDSYDEPFLKGSPKCHIACGMEGLAHVMINTDDPTYGTLWVHSPNSSMQHLELNITARTPKAPQRRRQRRRAAIRPLLRSLMIPPPF